MNTRSDAELLNAVRELVARVRGVTRELLVELGEVDARRLYLEEACSSMFAFCTTRLGFSEDVAYKRIQAARLGRRFPAVLQAFGAGRIHLAGLAILGPHMRAGNHRELLAAAAGLTKRQIEALVADRFPATTPPRRKGTLRRLRATVTRARGATARIADRGTGDRGRKRDAAARLAPGRADTGIASSAAQAAKGAHPAATSGAKPGGGAARTEVPFDPSPAPPEVQSAPGAEALYSLSLTVGKGFAEKLQEARAELSHSLPDGDLARILELGLDALLADARRRRRAERIRDRGADAPDAPAPAPDETPAAPTNPTPPRPGPASKPKRSRHIPAEVRRRVWARDQGRCTYLDAKGRRCGSRWFLQIDHVQPFARGGDNTVSNLRLFCAAHNRWRAIEKGEERAPRRE